MKRQWLVVPALALCFAGGLRHASAEDAHTEKKTAAGVHGEKKTIAGKHADKADRMNGKKDGHKDGKLPKRHQAILETVAGKPLTEDQVKLIAQEEADFKAAQEALKTAHHSKVAGILGVTPEQLEAGEKSAKEQMKAEMKEKKAAETAPATPAQ